MNHSTPGLPVHHQLPEFTQTHVPRVKGAIQPSHPLSSPSPPAPNPSQHQGFSNESTLCMRWPNSTWAGVSASVSVLPMNTQDRSPLGWTGWISLQSKGLSRVFSNTAVHQKADCWKNWFFLGGDHYLLKPSCDWMRPNHTMEDNLFCSKFSDFNINLSSVQSLSHVHLCNLMDCSTPGLTVHYQLLELVQTHVHWVGDAIQPSHPLLFSFSSCLNLTLPPTKKRKKKNFTEALRIMFDQISGHLAQPSWDIKWTITDRYS